MSNGAFLFTAYQELVKNPNYNEEQAPQSCPSWSTHSYTNMQHHVFIHDQSFRLPRCHDQILTDACRSSVLPIRSSNLSPLSSTLLMLSVRMTLTSFTWPCTWSILETAPAGGGWDVTSACQKWWKCIHFYCSSKHVYATVGLPGKFWHCRSCFKAPNHTSCCWANRKKPASLPRPVLLSHELKTPESQTKSYLQRDWHEYIH